MPNDIPQKQPSHHPRPDPFILRLMAGFLKRTSFGIAVLCFIWAALLAGFGLFALIAGMQGWKPMDPRLIAFTVFSSLVFAMLGRWCLRMSNR